VSSRWRRWWDDFWYELVFELRRLVELFSRPTTLIVIIGLVVFVIELYYGMIVALRYDTLMHLLGVQTKRCQLLANWQYLLIIYTVFASVVTLLYCMGSFVDWLRAREHLRNHPEEIRRLGWRTISFAVAVECFGGLAMWMLLGWC
jgi:hypothetical protein